MDEFQVSINWKDYTTILKEHKVVFYCPACEYIAESVQHKMFKQVGGVRYIMC